MAGSVDRRHGRPGGDRRHQRAQVLTRGRNKVTKREPLQLEIFIGFAKQRLFEYKYLITW